MKSLLSMLFCLFISSSIWAQERPFRIGAKVGVPNIITVNVEYVTPLLNNRVAFMVDYLPLSYTVDDTNINYKNLEIGTNIYFNDKGKGFYGGLSYFSFDGEGTFEDVEFDQNNFGNGTGNIKFNTINVKLGAKLGGTFYTRLEVGYGFGDIPETIDVRSESSNLSTIEEIPDIPGLSSSGLLIFNLGFGFSF